jgi:hypothetical protein
MPRIFISYRRADSRKDASRLYDRLVEVFGRDNIFKDVDSIPPGSDFRDDLPEAMHEGHGQRVAKVFEMLGGTAYFDPASSIEGPLPMFQQSSP